MKVGHWNGMVMMIMGRGVFSNNYCPGPVLVMSEDEGEDELNENGKEEMYKGRQKDQESCRNE